MAQEFTINSSAIESKINQLLPSQGGFGAGVDFSASTMVIPIVDLTESAEGSAFRVDLQSALSHIAATHSRTENGTATLVSTTGYYQVNVAYSLISASGSLRSGKIFINDGTTDKIVFQQSIDQAGTTLTNSGNVTFMVLLQAGDTLKVTSGSDQVIFEVVTRQIADLQGNLTNP